MRGKIYFSEEAAQTLYKKEAPAIVLTRREIEVLELIAGGMSNNEIAAKLFIGSTTVDTHRKTILLKFGLKNTAGLIRMATQMQLIN